MMTSLLNHSSDKLLGIDYSGMSEFIYFRSYILLLQVTESTRIQARGLWDTCPQGMFFSFPEKFAEKTFQLFVPNSKRLRGYTQWV
jgi:hypothetical protein